MKTSFIVLSVCSLLAFQNCRKNDSFDVCRFGAVGDGKTLCTKAFNDAIATCASRGGGTVYVPAGTYYSGTIVMKSNINLHLEPGAVILASRDTADYMKMPTHQFQEGYVHFGLIYAADCKNISLTGHGVINGNGTFFMNSIDKPHSGNDFDRKFTRQGMDFMRPGAVIEDGPVSYNYRPGMLVVMLRCENVTVQDLMFYDSPEWTFRIGDCEDVLVTGITIRNNQLIPNSDGIHCTTSRNVRISNCDIVAGDDAIIVTGFGDEISGSEISRIPYPSRNTGNKTGYAENVTVTNCVLSSRSAGIRVGYGENPIRNLVFSNIVIYGSNRGIGVFARDKSDIENVEFSNIIINTRLHSGHWWGKGEPIHVSAIRDSRNGKAGTIRNIRFNNIRAESGAGILLYGASESPLENITLKDVTLSIEPGKYSESYGGNFDLRPAYPLDSALFAHDIPGCFAKGVINLVIKDFNLKWTDNLPNYFSDGLAIYDFRGLLLQDVFAVPAFNRKELAAIRLVNGSEAELLNCRTVKSIQLLVKEKVR